MVVEDDAALAMILDLLNSEGENENEGKKEEVPPKDLSVAS